MNAFSKVQPLRIADASAAIRHVFIRNLEILAQIGIHGREKGTEQPVRINVDMAVEDGGINDDCLASVVDYETIANKIRALAAAGHINLAETMAERIAALCFEDPRVRSARVRVEKLYALPGAEAAGVEIERVRAG
jgi:7,8-dihydroneopterin aldolase/epimerase/oxygenase